MKKIIKMVALVLVISLITLSSKTNAEAPTIKKPQTTLEMITYYSEMYSVDKNMTYSILSCESGLNPKAIGDSGKAKQIAQYHYETFLRHEKKLGIDLDYTNTEHNIQLLAFALKSGYGREWTTYRSIINGGSYTFTSNGKTYNIKCQYKVY